MYKETVQNFSEHSNSILEFSLRLINSEIKILEKEGVGEKHFERGGESFLNGL